MTAEEYFKEAEEKKEFTFEVIDNFGWVSAESYELMKQAYQKQTDKLTKTRGMVEKLQAEHLKAKGIGYQYDKYYVIGLLEEINKELNEK
jgi:putative IMPACT (imprinted ancient) family translation regulator